MGSLKDYRAVFYFVGVAVYVSLSNPGALDGDSYEDGHILASRYGRARLGNYRLHAKGGSRYVSYAYIGQEVPRLVSKGSQVVQSMGSHYAAYNAGGYFHVGIVRGVLVGTGSGYTYSFFIFYFVVYGVCVVRGHGVLLFDYHLYGS